MGSGGIKKRKQDRRRTGNAHVRTDAYNPHPDGAPLGVVWPQDDFEASGLSPAGRVQAVGRIVDSLRSRWRRRRRDAASAARMWDDRRRRYHHGQETEADG